MREIEGENKKRLGVLDWFVLILILALFAGALFWYFWGRGKGAGEGGTVYYTVRVYDVDPVLLEAGHFLVGDAVFSENGTLRLGVVEGTKTVAQRTAAVQQGEVVTPPSPRFVSVDVRVRSDCVVKEGEGVRCDGVRIAAGENGRFRIGRFFASRATVISVETEEWQ